ncbi:MAG: DUF4197 domain-containing protein [Bacteroidetes bacterium]|nr:DUF4197 domain-containing protein [Bacteroidota bacterium]
MKKHLVILFSTATLLASCDVLMQAGKMAATSLIPSNDEVISGLKEALVNGVSSGTGNLNKRGAFFTNAALKILMPQEVRDVEAKIRNNSLLNAAIGGELDKCIQAMNDGAENAMAKAFPVFKNAIMSMSIQDAMGILKGGNGAATSYLKSTTTTALHTAFKPVIKSALDEVKISEYWTPVVTEINKPLAKAVLGIKSDINPDLNQYVTEKATTALFTEIEKEENAIRANPAKRTTEILKKVFNYADSQKGS